MSMTLKLAKLKLMLKSSPIYVRFQTNKFYKSGLLQKLNRKRDGIISCVFNENGNINHTSFYEDDIVDIVVFRTADNKPVFMRDFEFENKQRQYWE